jgi:hypothetical protein
MKVPRELIHKITARTAATARIAAATPDITRRE